MTKQELLKELKKINVKIDRLIIEGKSTKKEEKMHARIVKALYA